MADPEIFIVSRLNDCFGLDLTLVDFDEKAPGELLQLLLDVLAELDPRLRGDVRDRGAEAGAAGAATGAEVICIIPSGRFTPPSALR